MYCSKKTLLFCLSLFMVGCGGGGNGSPSDNSNGNSNEFTQLEIKEKSTASISAALDFIQYPAAFVVLSTSTPDILGKLDQKIIACNHRSSNSYDLMTIEATRLTKGKWSNGDQITVDFANDCLLSGLESPLSGRITITISMDSSAEESITSAHYHLDMNQLTQRYMDENGFIHVLSFEGVLDAERTKDDNGNTSIKISTNQTEPFTFANYSRLDNYQYSSTWSESNAQFSINTSARVSFITEKSYLDIATKTPLSGYIGETPNAGNITISGRNNTYVMFNASNSGMIDLIGKGSDFSENASGSWQDYITGGLWRFPTIFDTEERINLATFGEPRGVWSTMSFDGVISEYNNSFNMQQDEVYELTDVGLQPQFSVLINHKADVVASISTLEDPIKGEYTPEIVTQWKGQRLFLTPKYPLMPGVDYSLKITANEKSLGAVRFKTKEDWSTPVYYIDAGDDEFAKIGEDKKLAATYIYPTLENISWLLNNNKYNSELTLSSWLGENVSIINSSNEEPGHIVSVEVFTSSHPLFSVSSSKYIQYINSNKDRSFFTIDAVHGITALHRKTIIGNIAHDTVADVGHKDDYSVLPAVYNGTESNAQLKIHIAPHEDTGRHKVYHFTNSSDVEFEWTKGYHFYYAYGKASQDKIKWSDLCSNSTLIIDHVDPEVSPQDPERVAVNYSLTCMDNEISMSGRIRMNSSVE